MKARSAVLTVVGAFIVTGMGFAYWSNQPAETTPTNQANVKGAETPDYTLKPYSNEYFSGQLPARFTSRSATAGTGQPLLWQQLLAAPSDANLYADQFAISVGVLPMGGLGDVSSVQLRQRSDEYTELHFSWLPADGIAFERTDQGYELGVFLRHGTRYAALVLSGLNDRKEQMTHEMQLFVNSMSWQ